MTIIGPDGLISVTWFLVLWVLVLVVALLSRSLIANLALIFVCALGWQFGSQLAGVSHTVRMAVSGIFIACLALAIFQTLFKVEHI